MRALQRRLDKVERRRSSTCPDGAVILCEEGESEEAAFARHFGSGGPPEGARVVLIRIVSDAGESDREEA